MVHDPLPQVPLPVSSWRSQISIGTGTTLTDLQIDANAVWRGIGGDGGSDYGVNAQGTGWLVDRIWTRHIDANWLSGTNGVVQNSRTADSYGDGFNINNGNTPNANKLGQNITVRNNFARNTGDDSFATYSDAGSRRHERPGDRREDPQQHGDRSLVGQRHPGHAAAGTSRCATTS